jgi:hypothetical protein
MVRKSINPKLGEVQDYPSQTLKAPFCFKGF